MADITDLYNCFVKYAMHFTNHDKFHKCNGASDIRRPDKRPLRLTDNIIHFLRSIVSFTRNLDGLLLLQNTV